MTSEAIQSASRRGVKTNPRDAKFFDKKNYRIKKYSKKYKLEKWEQNRRKDVLKKFYKDIKDDPQAGKYAPVDFDRLHEEDLQLESSLKTNVERNDDVAPAVHYVMHPDVIEKINNENVNNKSDDKYKSRPFWKAKQELQRINEEKRAKKQAFLKAKQERELALNEYKKKKTEKFKHLSKKTKTGQPFMKDRMTMLLDRIQNITN